MKQLRIRRPSPAFLLAAIALFVALGGVSVAAVSLAPRSIKGAHIASNAITARHIADNAVRRGAIGRAAVGGREVRDGSLGAADFAPGALSGGVMVGTVNAAGTSSGNPDVAVTHLATGKYELTFPAGAGPLTLSVTPFGIDGAVVTPIVAGRESAPGGGTTFQVWLSNTTPGLTPSDNGFMFVAASG